MKINLSHVRKLEQCLKLAVLRLANPKPLSFQEQTDLLSSLAEHRQHLVVEIAEQEAEVAASHQITTGQFCRAMAAASRHYE